jgi:hypothetical protein
VAQVAEHLPSKQTTVPPKKKEEKKKENNEAGLKTEKVVLYYKK